jgi:Copper transport outer membrane protein, MctB
VSTVDDLDLTEGRIAAVLALSDLGRNVVGQYGFGAGAEKSLPAWSIP